ncbi:MULTISPECIES: TetR/AcrR family transcriptional regulator [Agrobacterium]|uniref:TetR family transcriptional regulator n=1 Tax=Agrobacterium burrii TaxID=2815339 RepID=A0ABS3EFK9_9HYPH|nr:MULTISPECIES: TetR/AcrR family transcriptional regulator [Agrobacterium]MBO0130745.1 TetR family transcriptional regulator [Agrobacterium burrii]MQB10475.1 TetR/AcrR family transcriptional regulator [Agrobacterium sp. ICMP 6402]
MFANMTNAHERKKQPEIVRRNLLDCAAKLAADQGVAALSVQAVADAAGVTKGGLFHHFASKQVLLEAVMADLLGALDAEIDALISQDCEAYGSFTRAYVNAVFDDRDRDSGRQWAAISVSMVGEPSLRRMWTSWVEGRLARHKDTDDGVVLEMVRLAADGIWFADLLADDGRAGGDRVALKARMIAQTTKETER